MAMTAEAKQLIVKAIEKGIPAIAQEHIRALDEVEFVAGAKQEELGGAEGFKSLNQSIHETIIKVLVASYPFMADEIVQQYCDAVNECLRKFDVNAKARQAAEQKVSKKKQAAGVKSAEKEKPLSREGNNE